MRANRRGIQALPKTRRRSGPRFRRRQHHQEATAPGNENRFGILLQAAVHQKLRQLHVEHRTIPNNDPGARSERIELVVETGRADVPSVEFQYTLHHRTRPKIRDFLRAAIQRASQVVPRVYLEIELKTRLRVHELPDRVAHAIRRIVEKIGSFVREAGNTVGLVMRVDERGRALTPEPLTLFQMIGSRAREWLLSLMPIPPTNGQPERKRQRVPYRPPPAESVLCRAFAPLRALTRFALGHARQHFFPIRQPR